MAFHTTEMFLPAVHRGTLIVFILITQGCFPTKNVGTYPGLNYFGLTGLFILKLTYKEVWALKDGLSYFYLQNKGEYFALAMSLAILFPLIKAKLLEYHLIQ